ncbi:hypothetical protein [Pseudogemmobacter bohemicus]|uniref:hypothetical protein n=1 Tax=Pseudogemmobacter bohemicus TaxID=2250708 RepID=UPI000DD4A610|nr:hypothetical protein [Pseudogemmobacter bohemicus]
MGDFERTFGTGTDAVSIVEGFSRNRGSYHPNAACEIALRLAHLRQSLNWGSGNLFAARPGYDEKDVEVNPEGVPVSSLVVFTSYRAVEKWDALGLKLAFTRSPDEDGQYVMRMIGQPPG